MTVSWEVIAAVVGWLITVAALIFRAGRITEDLAQVTQEVERLRVDLRRDLEALRGDLKEITYRYNDRLGDVERRCAELNALVGRRSA